MNWPAFAKRLILADGRIGDSETALLRRAILDDGVVDREEVNFLIELKRDAVQVHPAFDKFLFQVLRKVLLRDGMIADAEVHWLRSILTSDGRISIEEVGFLRELRREARVYGPEFDRLLDECARLDQTQIRS